MDSQKDMANILGLMDQLIKETLSRAQEMVMAHGKVKNKMGRFIKDTTCSTKNMDMEFMIGETGMCIKDSGWMI